MLFNFFINDVEGFEYTFCKFSDDPKLSGAVVTPEGQGAIQKDWDKLEKEAHVNLRRFNEARCKVLHLSQRNSGISTD